MADAAVEFLLGNLKQLLVYNAHLIFEVKNQVESLCEELRTLTAFVKDSTEKGSKFATVKQLVRRIRIVVYKAEDVIDKFVVQAAVQKQRSGFKKAFSLINYPLELRSVGKEIESIRGEVKEIYDNKLFGFEVLKSGESSNKGSSEKRAPIVEEENVVGFDKEVGILLDLLTSGSDELEVISVVGMGGLGKTTLARKVFTDPRIEYEFCNNRAWNYVSQEYNRREVFLGILNCVTQLTDDMQKMSDDKLAEYVRAQLQGQRYMIVLDDVWTKNAWDDLKIAFPNNNNRSRILLTSRNRDVAVHANPDCEPHHLRFLTDDESWELLQKKVFRKGSCPSELETLGKQIARRCFGLPLAIVVIAGLLLNKDKTRDWWERVAESVSSYVSMNPEQCMDVLALSYNHLPYHLKACFLYFGVFPEDFEIPVWKLIRLWVAEGFIQVTGEISLEDRAEENLEDLVDRNLILVATRRSNGRIKTCRIHDMLHDLCLREAAEENFFQRIKDPSPSSTSPLDSYRRLCVHSQVLRYISSKPSGEHVRSFLCFALEETNLAREHLSFIPQAFKLLRVLDIRGINFCGFPTEIIQLVHLRYIAIFGNFKVVPEKISDLWNLQTIIVHTKSRTLDIKADIWKMLQLRHLYTNVSNQLCGPPAKARKNNEDPFVGKNLQTISTTLPESCTENVLARTPNLKKLGIRGRLATVLDKKGGSSMFDNLAKLDRLATLKLLNDTYPYPPSDAKLTGLPQWYKFPPNLKKLTLSDTFLDWEHMSTLGRLPNLEVLKLKEYAFSGPQWETIAGGFQLLKILKLGRTDLEHWEASGNHFPRLQCVVLEHCEKLQAIPSGLWDVSSLKTMKLHRTSHSAAASAREIEKQRQEVQQQQSMVSSGPKLVIYPPDL
ncbi:hypothetical protein F0562_034368 [Nyssa sinensis]|uniref:NB-ARC domain-containing protein n=1 Tax=Nyssa sinensis TaxID=561372 RepID=A0A5J5AI52_9ASTE|nr:hypothetical protein F0562_034368 [Nyssa sinensis]